VDWRSAPRSRDEELAFRLRVRSPPHAVQRTPADTPDTRIGAFGTQSVWLRIAPFMVSSGNFRSAFYTAAMKPQAAIAAESHSASAGVVSSPARLLALLADGTEVSGSALALELGVTRAAVWKQIEQLRSFGLSIDAVAGRGYRLEAPVELLDAARITAAIDPAQSTAVGEIDVRWQIDSTSSELLRRAGSAPRACLAEIQTRGRGRRGRAWQTPLGGAIALSFLRRFDGGMAALSGLSLVAGIAVIRALADCGVEEPQLKWPNDVVARGRKLAGILVELAGDALGPCQAVVGVGLNLRMNETQAQAIDQPWIDLSILTGGAHLSRNQLAGRILSRLAEALALFAREGFLAFGEDYARRDALSGRRITVLGNGEAWNGIAQGVTARGALKVSRGDRDIEIDSAEVSVRG